MKKRLQHRCLPINIAKFLRIRIFKNMYERLSLYFRILNFFYFLFFLFIYFFEKWKNGKSKTRKSWKSRKSRRNYSEFCPTAKIENSDLKFLEKNFRDFRGFLVFDMAFPCGDLCVLYNVVLWNIFFPRMAFSSVLGAVPKNLFLSPNMVATFCKH